MSKIMKRITIIVVALLLVGSATLFGLSLYGKEMMKKIPPLSFQEALDYTLKDNEDAIISVGIFQNGESSITVYGNNSEVLPTTLHTYEIGSLTKTFTATMIAKASRELRINLDETIDSYLDLPADNNYPTINELLTHTSGYKNYYFELPMVSNFLSGRNDFYGINSQAILDKVSDLEISTEDHDYNYSNFGYAVLGLVLEEVYEQDYSQLMDEYLANELNLSNTHIANKTGDLDHYWAWQEDDAYLAAGALVSNMEDMLAYAQLQLEERLPFSMAHRPIKEIDATTSHYELMNIHLDTIGMSWIIDEENEIVWHNGGTGHYNSYLGFDSKTGVAVVILSNLSPNSRIPATVLGIKLMEELRD